MSRCPGTLGRPAARRPGAAGMLRAAALGLMIALTACLPAPTVPEPAPATATLAGGGPPTTGPSPTAPAAAASPADSGPPTATFVPPEYLNVAIPTINPDDPLRFIFPTPIVYPTPLNWRPPVVAVPIAARPEDHFWFARPIASDQVNWPLGSYRYGSTYFGNMNIHAGIDIDAPPGTPILAAGPGEVVWAGWGLFYFEPGREDDPYGIAVAIRHDFGYQGQPLYTLYAHMQAEDIQFVGQRVSAGDVLGWVGTTGNSTGPHVHFEVRVGRNDYFHTRNPELWIAPYSGWGVLVGQLLTADGRPIVGAPIEIFSDRGRYVATVYTYGVRVARPDDVWQENFAISDLPAGRYSLKTNVPLADGSVETLPGQVQVAAGQANYVRLQVGQGVSAEAAPPLAGQQPYPSNTPTDTPTPTRTYTPTPTSTPRPTRTPTLTRTPRPSLTPTLTRTPSATPSPRFSATPSATPRPSLTPTLQAAP